MTFFTKLCKHLFRAIFKKAPKRYHLPKPYSNTYITEREKIILFYLSKGASLIQISDTLGLHPRTIQFFLGNLQKRIGISYQNEILQHPGILQFVQEHFQ